MSTVRRLMGGGLVAGLGYALYQLFTDKEVNNEENNQENNEKNNKTLEPTLEKIDTLSKSNEELQIEDINLDDISDVKEEQKTNEQISVEKEKEQEQSENLEHNGNETDLDIREEVKEELSELNKENSNDNIEKDESIEEVMDENIHRIVQI